MAAVTRHTHTVMRATDNLACAARLKESWMPMRKGCPMQSSGTVVADSRITRVASGTGWILVALGLIVLAGWAFRVHALMGILPSLATMKPNTAAAMILTGVALLRRNHSDLPFYGLGVLLLGAAALAEYL